MPRGSLVSKPTWSNTSRVFSHVGFFCFRSCATTAASEVGPGQSQKGRLIMYIGGGLLTLVIVIVLIVYVLRR